MKILSLGGSGGSNTALSNLASVAINTSLISDTDNTDDLGSAAKQWKEIFGVTGTFTGLVKAARVEVTGSTVSVDGLFLPIASRPSISCGSTEAVVFSASVVPAVLIRSNFGYGWVSAAVAPSGGTVDTLLYRAAAGVVGVGTTAASASNVAGFQPAQSANGATVQILGISELLTLSIAGTTTDTTANLLPAGAIIKTVVGRVTTTITTATNWQIGDPTTAGRFTPVNSTMVAGTTDIGRVHMTTGIASATTGMYQAAAAKVRITTTGTPGAGVVRLTTFYELLTPPTS